MPTTTIPPILLSNVVRTLRQYDASTRVVFWFPNREHCEDLMEAIDSGRFGARESFPQFAGAACGGQAVMAALRDQRIEFPQAILILRVFSPCLVAFVSAEDILRLHPALAPLAIIGSGRAETYRGWFGTKSIMRETLHMDSKFHNFHLGSLMAKPQPGVVVMDLGFAYSPAENVVHAIAGAMFAFTTVLVFNPLTAGLAGVGIAIGKLFLPYGVPIKALIGWGASQLGPLVARLPLIGNNVHAENIWGQFQVDVVANQDHLSPADFLARRNQEPGTPTPAPAPHPTGTHALIAPSTPSLSSNSESDSDSDHHSARIVEINDDSDRELSQSLSRFVPQTGFPFDLNPPSLPDYEPVDPNGTTELDGLVEIHSGSGCKAGSRFTDIPDGGPGVSHWKLALDAECSCGTCFRALEKFYNDMEAYYKSLSAPMPPPKDVDFPDLVYSPGSSKHQRPARDFKAALAEIKRKAKEAMPGKGKGKGKQREQ